MPDYTVAPGYHRLSALLVELGFAADYEAAIALIPTVLVNGEAVVDVDPLLVTEDDVPITLTAGDGSGDPIPIVPSLDRAAYADGVLPLGLFES